VSASPSERGGGTVTVSVILRCGDRLIAVPSSTVVEVFRMAAIASPLPRAPRSCMGVVDYRGRLVPLFDLAARLGILPPRDQRALVDAHVVVLRDSAGEVGFVVDEVRELSEAPVEELAASAAAGLGRLAIGAVRTADGRVAPLVGEGGLLSLLARKELREALDAFAARGEEGA
jgi:chemotaxis signal transduction protein